MDGKSVKDIQRNDVRSILLRAKANNQVGVRPTVARSRKASGKPFGGLEKAAVWLNAAIIPGKDIALWRQDRCGAAMFWHDYGDTKSVFGWEVDHITPIALGGTDAINNLQALQWQNNRRKGDDVGGNYCEVTNQI